MQVHKTNTVDSSFLELEKLLDHELQDEFPGEMEAYAPHNKFKSPIKAIVISLDQIPVACGAFKEIQDHVEIKRMFVHPDHRGKGLSKTVLTQLEQWASTLGYQYAILETGDSLFKAIQLYTSTGYQKIPNYPPYTHLSRSVCFKKHI